MYQIIYFENYVWINIETDTFIERLRLYYRFAVRQSCDSDDHVTVLML